MSSFKKLDAAECARRLIEIERPLVVMHVRPDGDTVGSGIALVRILKALGKDARFISSDPIPERLKFIIDGEKEAPRGEDLFEYNAIAIDVASPAQLGELNGKITPCLMIDHHEVGTPFADNYTLPGKSSAGEVLAAVLDELVSAGAITVSESIARALYTAISSDTGGFVFSNTSPETLRRAADLLEAGVDHAAINHALFHSKSKEQLSAEGFTAANMKTARDGRVAYALVSREDKTSLGVSWEHFDTAIDVVRSLLGVKVAFIIKELDKGVYKASLRSTGRDVASVAAHFGGGGHIRAAGCTVKAESLTEAEELVLEKIKELEL